MQNKRFRKYMWITIGIITCIGMGWFTYNAITSKKNVRRLAEIANQICMVQYNDMMDNAREDKASSEVLVALEQAQPVFCKCFTEYVLVDADIYLNMPLGQVLEILVKDEKGVAFACMDRVFFGE